MVFISGILRLSNEEIRGLLGQMLFARDEGDKKTDVLSGGEAARCLLQADAAEAERAGVRRTHQPP